MFVGVFGQEPFKHDLEINTVCLLIPFPIHQQQTAVVTIFALFPMVGRVSKTKAKVILLFN